MLANEIDAYIAGHDHSMQHIYYTNRTGHDYIISAGGGRGENDAVAWEREQN